MSDAPQRYQPRTPHKGRPNGLQPIINRFPLVAESIITERMENHCTPIHGYGVMFRDTKKRQRSMLQKICKVFCAAIDWCQLDAKGLIGVPHGSERQTRKTTYMPMTKNKRCDTEDGDKDYMYGLAELSGVEVRLLYEILGFLCDLGLMEHDGYETHLNKDEHVIRISKYLIPEDMRTALFKMCELPLVWRDRYEKKNAKAIAKANREPTPPRPPVVRAGIPVHITEDLSAKAREINEALKSTVERTAAETFDLLQAFGRCLMPQGP